jgi:hypothetical protein
MQNTKYIKRFVIVHPRAHKLCGHFFLNGHKVSKDPEKASLIDPDGYTITSRPLTKI